MIGKLLQKEDEHRYEAFIERAEDSKIYHTLEWKQIIERTYGYKPYYVIVKDGVSIKGVLPLFEVRSLILGKRLVSIPFSHRVNILHSDDPAVLHEMLDFACGLAQERDCRYLEIKHGDLLPDGHGLECSEFFFNSVLDLSRDIDEIWSDFESGSVRWGINRAKRSDLEIERGTTLEDYRKFYRLELVTRKTQGVPPYPFRFFEYLHAHLDDSGRARLLLAYLDGVCIAGIILLCYNKQAIYGYGASLKEKEYLRTQPNNLLLWTAIQELHSEDFQKFDFGTTHPSNEGLLKFKSRWGTMDYKIPYYYFLNKAEQIPTIDRTSKKMNLITNILQRMPVAILKRVGPFLLKQVG